MAPPLEAQAIASPPPEEPGRCRSVLIADASARDREQLAREFGDLGLTTLAVESSRRIGASTSLRPDLVVLDEDPVDQAEAVSGLRRAYPGARVVILTAYPSFQASFDAGRSGVGAYLLKPMRAREILRAIGACPLPAPAPAAVLPSLERQRREYIEWVLALHEGNKTRAARALGIPRYSLQRIRARFPPTR